MIIAWLQNIGSVLHRFVEYSGYWGFFILMIIESTSLPIILPAEVVLISAGYFIVAGKLSFTIAVVVCTCGSVIGAFINYFVAYSVGRSLLTRYGKYIFIKEASIVKFETLFNKHAIIVTFIGRFLPFVKHICSIPPGLSRMNPLHFALATAFGAGIFSSIMLYIGMKFGENASDITTIKHYLEFGLIIFVIISVSVYFIYSRFANKAASSADISIRETDINKLGNK